MRGLSNRRGFTFLEILMVMIVAGLIFAISIKSVRGAFAASARRSATREVTAYLFRARSIGVQQSRRSWLVRSGNVLKIVIDSAGTLVQVGTQIDMNARYAATLSATPKDSIQFDPRGFVVVPGSTPKLIVTRGTSSDTLCVTGLGRITVRGC
ncbi:MAG TPA: prepilin-type N-terminal cleavage/methylation domain-containing protein [Gemmatimonadales bacterium]|nr:prepilin-type N-terminal cleavage/methylation domain-containing protein [Gemmatimonadales bacterium]